MIEKGEVDKIAQLFFDFVIEDLNADISDAKAGWRNPAVMPIKTEIIENLVNSGLLLVNEEGLMRINFENMAVRRKFKEYKLRFKQIDSKLQR